MPRMLVLEPNGWPCSVRGCPDGLFVWDDDLYLKQQGRAMWLDGVAFDPHPANPGMTGEMLVQPVRSTWREIEEN